MYQLEVSGYVKRLADGAFIPPVESNADYQHYLAWVAEGNTPEPYVAPAPTVDDYTVAVQAHLDAQAKGMGYDSIFTAVGYRGDPNLQFADEAERLFVWRSAVWTKCVEVLAAVQGGQRPAPTIAELISELPAFI